MPAAITTTESIVNTITTGDQLAAHMVRLAGGGWVIVWMSREEGDGEYEVRGQRYAESGAPVGAEFHVSSIAPGRSEYNPNIAALPDGGWIVTWHSIAWPFTGFGDTIVYTRRYDASGTPAPEVPVNAPDGYPHGMLPVVAVLADGGWVIALHSERPDGAGRDIYGYRYDSAGSTVGIPFRINASAAGDQDTAAIAALNDGGWLVTWQSQGQDGSGSGIYQQRYAANGSPVGGEALVNMFTTAGNQQHPSVAALTDGGWIVAWMSANVDGSGYAVVTQRFQASGALFGGQNQVNGIITGDQAYPTIIAMADGGYLVRWLSEDVGVITPTGGRQMGIYVQRHDSAGGSLAPANRIGTSTENDLDAAALAASATGWITAWAEYGADGSSLGIKVISSAALPQPFNVIEGTGDDDSLTGTAGNDLINGLGGADLLVGLGGNDILNGGDGHDQLRGDGFTGYLGPWGNDVLSGGSGDDVLWGGAGVDSHDGGLGFDRVSFAFLSATQGAIANLITQTISNDGFGNSEAMVSIEALGGGTVHADHFTGNDDANRLFGDFGDTLIANGGDDELILTGAAALVSGGLGIDTLTYLGDQLGSWTPDVTGDNRAEIVFPAHGININLNANAIVDDGFGRSGTISGIENLTGGGFADTLVGDGNANLLRGLGGNDVLIGFAGDDMLEGGEGHDVLIGAAGWDSLDGGDGSDTVVYGAAIGPIEADLALGVVGEFDGATHLSDDTLSSIENVIGSNFDDIISGNSNSNFLRGLFGADVLFGRDGDDTLEGSEGDDLLFGGAGWDILNGGAGVDTVSYNGATGPVEIDLNMGVASEFDGATHLSDDTLTGVENAFGSQFADYIRGDNNANLLRGLGGNDFLEGLGGDDTIQGGAGHDFIRGYDGNDNLQGGDGDDALRGGNGDDVMDGGTGFDRAAFFGTPGEGLPAVGVTVSLMLQGVAQDTGHGWDTLNGFEALSGTAYDDHLTGDDQANWLLLVGGGNDTAVGGDGDDLIEVGDGNHDLDGGAGIDTVAFSHGWVSGPVFVSLCRRVRRKPRASAR